MGGRVEVILQKPALEGAASDRAIRLPQLPIGNWGRGVATRRITPDNFPIHRNFTQLNHFSNLKRKFSHRWSIRMPHFCRRRDLCGVIFQHVIRVSFVHFFSSSNFRSSAWISLLDNLFQNCYHSSILSILFKLALAASFFRVKFKRTF